MFVSIGLLAALPLFGQLSVSAATSPVATHAASSSVVSPHATPFHGLKHRAAAISGARTVQRVGRTGLTRKGNAAARPALRENQFRSRPTSVSSPRTASLPIATPPSDALAQFPGISQGLDGQNIAPPDTDMAAGPTDLLETANSALYVMSRSGALLGAIGLDSFMNVTPGYYSSDPRVIYDAASQRFWLTITEVPSSFSCSTSPQPVLIAVSASSNPLPFTSWLVYALPFSFTGALIGDQPGLGISSNTLAVTYNEYDCNNNFLGSTVNILQKTDYENNTGNISDVYFHGGEFAPQPVQSFGAIATQYTVTNASDCGVTLCAHPAVFVDAFHGTPEPSGNVTVTGFAPAMTPTAIDNTSGFLPPAQQSGTTIGIQTDDDRFQNAVWENGMIWTSGGTMCTPTGDTTMRSCLDFVGVTASSAGAVNATITQLNNVGVNGSYLFYPAVSVDSLGNVVTVFDESSSTTFASIVDATIPAGTSTLSSFQTLHTSTGYYDPSSFNPNACAVIATVNACRWGDYSGAAQDPSNPKDVWVVSEAQDGALNACNANECWGSDISLVTTSAPIITSLTPASGPVAGGQTVTVNGLDFGLDTTATFGGTPLTISHLTPKSFTFVTAPSALAGGTDQVQATDALGATVPNAASLYTYIGLANYVPVTPFRLYDTRPSSPLGQAAIRAVRVTGVGTTPIPATATAVVVNVTEVDGSSPSLLTVYPFGTARPNASNLNFAGHTVIANLVTVTLGANAGQGWINIYNAQGSVNVVVDVEGYFAPDVASDVVGLFHPISPVRVCDTRHPSPTPICSAHGALGPGASMVVNFATTGGLPGDGTAAAAVVNLTGVAGTAATYLSLFPTTSSGGCKATGTSTINLPAGAVQANRVMVTLGPSTSGGVNDAICVFNSAGTINVLVDANGWYGSSTAPPTPAGYQYQALAPTRICDTRYVPTSCSLGSIGAAATRPVTVAGRAGIPAAGGATTVVAIVANLTAIMPTATTFLTLYPANLPVRPTVSDLNLNAGVVLPNLAVVQIDTTGDGTDGEVSLYNSAGSVNAIIDVEGWFQ